MKKFLCTLIALAALASLALNVFLLRDAAGSDATLTYMEPDRQYQDGDVKTLRALVDHPAAYQNRDEASSRLRALLPAAAIRANGAFSRTRILNPADAAE